MVVNEFEPDDIFIELNRKFANVSIDQPTSTEYIYKEIMYDDLYEYRDTLEFSTNITSCHHAMKSIRRYLTQNISWDRIQNVFDLGIQDRIKSILETPGYDELKYETAWTVTNLAYGTQEQTKNLIDTGIIDALVHCFRSTEDYRVKSQSAWALTNVSIESPIYRESMAQENLIEDVAQALAQKCEIVYNKLNSVVNQEQIQKGDQGQIICKSKTDSDDVKDLTWSLANICRGGFKTVEHWRQYLVAFNAFSQCIHFDNEDIWSEACWGLSRILSNMYNFDPFFEALNLNPRLCPRMINLLKNQSSESVFPVLQTISNFSSGPNSYIEVLLNADLLNSIWWYLTPDTHQQLRRNAMLTVSNLAAGHEQIVRKVVYNENIMQSVMSHITVPGHIYHHEECQWVSSSKAVNPETKEEWRIVKEALWVLSNVATLADDDCICALLRTYSKLIKSLASLLHFSRLPASICLKIVEILIRIIERTSKIAELTPPVQPHPRNPFSEEMMREGVIQALRYLCKQVESEELTEQTELLYTAIMPSHPGAGVANAFGLSRSGLSLPGPNVRRIVHSLEDGDVRLIEDAIHGIKL